MREELKRILKANRVQIVEGITLNEDMWNRLISAQIVTEEVRDTIQVIFRL